MGIVGLDHVQVAIPPGVEEEARAFYGKVLGMTEVNKPPKLAERGGCWFEGPGTVLHLGVESGFQPAKKAHPAFLVDDLDKMVQHLEKEGIASTPDDNIPGTRRVYISDPFGNRIELIQAE